MTIMELCVALIIIASISLLSTFLPSLNSTTFKSNLRIPRGPKGVPFISTILWLLKSTLEIEKSIRLLRSKYGEIITIKIGPYPVIFISSRSLAHQALVQQGALFANRPSPLRTAKILTGNKLNISLYSYGLTWSLLRRNLTAHINHPSRAKDFSVARRWALGMLLDRLRAQTGGAVVQVLEHFRFAIFSLMVFICFGDKFDELKISEIEAVQRRLQASFNRFFILDFCSLPITRILFFRRWNELYELKKKRHEILLPLIKEREEKASISHLLPNSYVDTLLKLELPENGINVSKRKLTEEEFLNLCSEFLNGGTDTTAAALQWTMANLVKYPNIQAKLFNELKSVIGENSLEVKEDDLSKMPYLKAVVLEGLRRHPPSHFVLPHAVTQEAELGGYRVPKNAIINFTVAEMGLDPKAWENPMQFEPEKFLSREFDITGRHEIKMMPFGAGRRMCPAYRLALLHLEYFVANLVWNFEWVAKDGDEVDLSEKQEFSIVMKYPLQALIFPRQTIK